MISLHDHSAVSVFDIFTGESSCNSVSQTFDGLLTVHERLHHDTRNLFPALAAVGLADDQFLRYVNHTSGQVTGVGCTQRRVGKSFTCAVGGHEILQYVQSFTEVGLDGQLDGSSCGIRHQSAHAGQLFDLLVGTAGAGVRHHIDIIIFIQSGQKHLCQLLIRLVPGLNDRTVSLFLRDQTTSEIHGDLVNRSLCLLQHLGFSGRHGHVGDGNRHRGSRRIFITCGLDQVKHLGGPHRAVDVDDLLQYLL